ncbi:hypothetical protein CsSME_00046830 [Camellia sinensis var. sinensis]
MPNIIFHNFQKNHCHIISYNLCVCVYLAFFSPKCHHCRCTIHRSV